MQGIYTYIPKENHVSKEYNVAAVLSLLFMAPISLAPALTLTYFYISTFRSMCAVPNMAVFCSSLTSWFPGMALTYFLNDSEMVSVAPIITSYHPNFYIIIIFFSLSDCSPARAMASSFTGFHNHTQRRATVGRTPLDEWSARRRDLYLTTHNRQTSMPRWDSNPRSQQGERS
jgi:hypothetical protein